MKFFLILSSFILSPLAFSQFDETKIQIPVRDSNEQGLQSTICRESSNGPWNLCSILFDNNDEMEKSFSFTNTGENKIVPKSGFGVGRSYEFMFEDFARSDLSLLVWDMPDEVESHGHLKMMMFFPREILPAIRYESVEQKDLMIVTLPTREEVVFDANTREVISGVFKESPIAQDSEGNGLNPSVVYTGKGVAVEADRLNDYPVGISKSGKNNTATITKAGFKPCKIPAKNLWYTDNNKGGNVFFNKDYVTDEAFDKLLKKKCKFSMY